MTTQIILNPYAARWEAGKRQDEIEFALKSAGVSYQLAITNAPKEATQIAKAAAEDGAEAVIAAGGDGTIGEVVNGLMSAANHEERAPKFGIIPVGTANDLACNLEFPLDIPSAAQRIKNGQTRPIDVCQINDFYFINNAGLGLEPYISIIQADMTNVRGIFRYILATLRGIADNPQWHGKITWDDGEYEGQITLISLGNGARTGGVFFTVPHADPFDGKLSFIYGNIPTRWKIMRALPKILKPAEGNIAEHPAVHEIHTTTFTAEFTSPTPAHADGEVFARAIQRVTCEILPGRLPLLV